MGNCVSGVNDVKDANRLSPVSLQIKHFTWNRDSHGLFDYENKNVIKGQLKTNAPQMRIIRQKDSIKIIQTKEELLSYQSQSDIEELLRVNRQFSKYNIESFAQFPIQEESQGLQDNCPWLVVKSTKSKISESQGYDLSEDDYVKLGRVRFRIREINCSQNNQITKNPTVPELQKFISEKCLNPININTEEDDRNSQADEPQCRICYNESETNSDNPLVDCCNCQGSVKYIHIQCLQTWLASKLQAKTTRFSVSFQWKQFECEVCKAIIPNRIKYKERIYETIVIPKPEAPYITLEILSRDRNQSKGTHIISFAQKNQIKLGRGHDSDVRITDISVSRCHAIIKFQNSGFILEDQSSKFGTLILLKKQLSMSIEQNNNLAIQIGRSVIAFQVQKDWNVQSCCMRPINQEQIDEEEKNELIGNAIADEDQNQAQIDQVLEYEDNSP